MWSRHTLGWLLLLPSATLLIGLLAYPLGLGIWLGFTDATIGRPGEWIGFDNFERRVAIHLGAIEPAQPSAL